MTDPTPDPAATSDATGLREAVEALAANQRRVRPGGLMRCCLATLGEAEHETQVGDVLACKYEASDNEQMIVAADGIWEWNHE